MGPRNALILLVAAALPACTTSGFNTPVAVPDPRVRTTPGGVSYEDLVAGQGEAAVPRATVRVHYVGQLEDGKTFDSSYERGRALEFTLGAGQVVLGWEEGMLGMRAGGKRRITIPPERAYGEEGLEGVIPPGATLVLEVELLEVVSP